VTGNQGGNALKRASLLTLHRLPVAVLVILLHNQHMRRILLVAEEESWNSSLGIPRLFLDPKHSSVIAIKMEFSDRVDLT